MKVHVIGGGPAGLYFAILMKKAWPQTRITVFERNRPDDTFGFGVVFSDQTLDTFETYDRESYRAIIGHFAYWDDIEIHFRGTTHRIGGNGFCGCSRATLLKILGRRARSLGVEIKYQTRSLADRSGDPRRRSGGGGGRHQFAHARGLRRPVQAERRSAAELLLLDGLDPAVRCLHLLLPRDRARHLHRALLPVRAAALDLDHRDRSARPSRAPASTSSTRRHRRASSKACSPRSCRATGSITNRSIWRNFPTIRCERWVADNMRADRRRQGDRAFLHRLRHQARDGGRDRALRGVPRDRRPRRARRRSRTSRPRRREEVEKTQHSADVSLVWFEHVKRFWNMDPTRFAFGLMTRSKAITYDNLALRAPEFVERGRPGRGARRRGRSASRPTPRSRWRRCSSRSACAT